MKHFKITAILLMAPLIFMMVFGCGEPTYTADQWEQKQAREEVMQTVSEDKAKAEETREVRQYVASRAELAVKMGEKLDRLEQEDYDSRIKVVREWISELRLFYVPEACEEIHSLELQFYRTVEKQLIKLSEHKRITEYALEAIDEGQSTQEMLDEANDIMKEIQELSDEWTELSDQRDRKYRELSREYDMIGPLSR